MVQVKARQLFSDGVQVLAARVLSVAGTAGVSILVSRALGPDGRGTYVVPGIAVALATTVFAGLSTAIASSMLKDGAGRGALRAAFVAAIPLVACGIVVTTALTAAMHALWAAPYAAAALPFLAISAIVNGYAYGRKNVRAVAFYAFAAPIVTLSMLAIGFFLRGPSPWVAIPIWVASNVLVAVVGLTIVLWTARSLDRQVVSARPFLKYALAVGATSLVSMLNYRINLYIVAALTSHSQLGFYTTAVSAVETLLIAAQVGSMVTVPHMGSLPKDEAAYLTARCVRNNFALVGACGIVAVIVAPFMVELLYGPAFLPAVTPLRILVLGMVPWSAASIISSYFTLASRRPQVALCTASVSAALCAGIAFVLVQRFGIVGAAIATTLTYAGGVLFMSAYFSRQTRIKLWRVLFVQPEDLRGYRKLAASFWVRPVATGVESSKT